MKAILTITIVVLSITGGYLEASGQQRHSDAYEPETETVTGVIHEQTLMFSPRDFETEEQFRPVQEKSTYAAEYAAIVKTMEYYIESLRTGKGDDMRRGFHPDATIVSYGENGVRMNPIKSLFDTIDKNGPAPDIEARISNVELLETIASVRLELEHWSGKVAGADARRSDLFTLVTTEEGWKILQKAYHSHR